MVLAKRLKIARIEADMGQQEAADAVGVTRVYLSKIENGYQRPSLSLVEKLADAYNMDLSIVLIAKGETQNGSTR